MHLEPANLRRVVDTALRIDHQLPLIPIPYDEHDRTEPTPSRVQRAARSRPRGRPPCKGLYTRLEPDVPRPITFDPDVAEGRNDVVVRPPRTPDRAEGPAAAAQRLVERVARR